MIEKFSCKNFRNINFVTYCDGTKVFKKIEELLENKMEKLEYSSEEIKQILSQVCLAAISGSSLQGHIKATSLLLGDKNDHSFNGYSQFSESEKTNERLTVFRVKCRKC